MKRKITESSFKVHASLMSQLGDQLIEDDITAISELIKNSYDADATVVELYIDPDFIYNDEQGKIEIIDDGCGMNKNDILNGWMKISASKKREMKKNKKLTEKYNRYPLGEKGLGRLSAMRLGSKISIITKKASMDEELILEIDWKDFENDSDLSDISFDIYSNIISNEERSSYTKLIITDLNDISIWQNTRKINKLEKELSKIISPFEYHGSFMIYAKIGEREIEFEKISNEVLNSARSKYKFKFEDNKIFIEGIYTTDYFFDKDNFRFIKKNGFEDFFNEYSDELKNKNFILGKKNELMKFKDMTKLENIGGVRSKEDMEEIYHPGDFSGEIYSYSLDYNYIKNQILNDKLSGIFGGGVSGFKQLLKKNSGVKVFRDQFRILPYGRVGNDWLNISRKQSTTGTYYFLKNENILGFVNLSGYENDNLREKTDRGGFIDNDYYQNFELILNKVIDRINYSRDKLKRIFNKYEKKTQNSPATHEKAIEKMEEMEKESEEVKKEVNKVKKEFESISKQNSNNDFDLDSEKKPQELVNKVPNLIERVEKYLFNLENIKSYKKVLKDEYSTIVEQLERITELAGLGLSAEAVTHELYAIVNNIKKETRNIKQKINYNDEELIKYLDRVYEYSDGLRKQISHLSPGFRNVRKVKKEIDIKKLLEKHVNYHNERAKRKDISINLSMEKPTYKIYANEGMITQVLDNLYYNTEYWLNHAQEKKLIDKSKYYLKAKSNGKLIVWDNGLGIDPSLNERIFEPFVSNKEEGRGLGLFIVRQLLNSNEAYIELKQEKNKFENLYKFELDFSNCIKE